MKDLLRVENLTIEFGVHEGIVRAVDNGLLLEAKIDLPFTANLYRAQNIGQQTLNQSRYGVVVKFSAFQEGLRCEVGDVVPITHSTPGWSGKLFRILQIEINAFGVDWTLGMRGCGMVIVNPPYGFDAVAQSITAWLQPLLANGAVPPWQVPWLVPE